MLNLWLGGLVCCACIAIGWFERLRYQKRVNVAGDLVTLVAYIEEQIRYNMTSLPRIFEGFYALHPRSAVAEACKDYPVLKDVPTTRGEWAEVSELLLSLGRSDLLGQEGRLSFVRARFEAMQSAAAADCRGKGNLYAKLWCILGVGLLIWMV